MLRIAIIIAIFLPSIRAALSRELIASALIAAENTGTLGETFKTFEKEQDVNKLTEALADLAEVQTHAPKVTICLSMAHDPFPKDEMCVSQLVHGTLSEISLKTWTDTESFTNAITSFKPSDTKLFVAIRHRTFWRDDAVNVLKSVMEKSPGLITDDLPSWIAFHSLDQNSLFSGTTTEEAFEYLTSFATEDVFEKALDIVKRNEHYKVAYKNGYIEVMCCDEEDDIPKDLADRIEALLVLVKARKASVNDLAILPKVLVDMILDYAPN